MKAPGLHGASRPFRQDWLGETPGRPPPHNPKTPLKKRRRGGPRLERGVGDLADQSRENLGFVRTHEPALSLATRTGDVAANQLACKAARSFALHSAGRGAACDAFARSLGQYSGQNKLLDLLRSKEAPFALYPLSNRSRFWGAPTRIRIHARRHSLPGCFTAVPSNRHPLGDRLCASALGRPDRDGRDNLRGRSVAELHQLALVAIDDRALGHALPMRSGQPG